MSPARIRRFFGDRWHARTPQPTLVWRDMLVVGTLVNLTASFAALALLAAGLPAAIAVALHLVPLPYNLFLFAALLRQPCSFAIQLVAGAWFVLMLVL